MLWILHENMYPKDDRSELERQIAALLAVGATPRPVTLIPFFGVFVPEIGELHEPVVALGSTTMNRVVQERGWKPGVFFNANFRFEAWRDGFGAENLFNGDARVIRFADLEIDTDTFIRPCEDLKAFTGFVTSPPKWADWKKRVLEGEKSSDFTQLAADTMIVAAEPRPIYREYRLFVVDGRVVSASLYRTHQGIKRERCEDPEVLAFGQAMAERWNPAEAYALDLAHGDAGLKVLEVNCFNNAGTYECDLVKIYGAVERMFGPR